MAAFKTKKEIHFIIMLTVVNFLKSLGLFSISYSLCFPNVIS